MSRQGLFFYAAVFLAVSATTGCTSVDLKTQVQVVDVSSGYYDNGITAAGMNHLVPSVTFSLRNISDKEVSSIDMVVMYWAAGQDTEQDESLLKVVGGSGLPAGATTEPVVSRSRIGFTLAAARAELFNHSAFRDWTAKLFLKRGGKIVPAGEYKIDHRLVAQRAHEVTPAAEATAATSSPSLERRLGPLDAAAIILSNVIGGGIFYVPVLVAGLVPVAAGMLGVWVLGGVLAFAGAMAYAELAALRPRSGGEYVYLREAFGPLAAFLTGWTSFVAGFSGAIAATALFLADAIGRFVPAASSRAPLLEIPIPFAPLVVTNQTLVALAAIAMLSFIHMLGLGPGRLVHNFLAGLKVSGILIFLALGLSLGSGSWSNLASSHDVAAPATGWLLALIPVMFSYSGWNAAVYVAEEIRNPGRNVPIALGLGTAAVVAIYVALNVLYLYAMPLADLAVVGDGRLTDTVAERLFGFVAGNVIAIFTIVSVAASISAMVLAGPRVYFAMARDGAFLKSVARVHPRYRTPARAIWAQAAWSGVLVLSSTLSGLVNYTGFAIVLFSGIAVASLFVLRMREPNAERPFRAWGYPYAPGLFVAASTAMIVHRLWTEPSQTLYGLIIIGAGIPLYLLFARKN